MELDNTKLKILETLLGKQYIPGQTDLTGLDLAPLMYESAKDGFLSKYFTSTESPVNSLLYGGRVSKLTESLGVPSPADIEELKTRKKKFGGKSRSSTGTFKYSPITIGWAKQIIEIDQVMRAIKGSKKRPKTVYRGTTDVDSIRMEGLISTSLSKKMAVSRFYKGCLLKINLPDRFPYFNMHLLSNVRGSYLKKEEEVILPPCEYEIVGIYNEDYTYYDEEDEENVTKVIKVAEINVKPLNFVEQVIKAMENLPADYPKEFVEDPEFEFAQALEMLKNYVLNEVEQGKIKIDEQIIEEVPNTNISFGDSVGV